MIEVAFSDPVTKIQHQVFIYQMLDMRMIEVAFSDPVSKIQHQVFIYQMLDMKMIEVAFSDPVSKIQHQFFHISDAGYENDRGCLFRSGI